MNLTKILLAVAFFGLGFFVHSLLPNKSNSGWQPVLQVDIDRSIVYGTKEQLMDAIRNGYNIRLAWGWESGDKKLEHVADPIWIAIINEEEVMVHLSPQVLSAIDWEAQRVNYEDSTLHNYEWRVAISTNGDFDAVWFNRVTNEIHRRVPQKHLMTWLVEYPEGDPTGPAIPLFETR